MGSKFLLLHKVEASSFFKRNLRVIVALLAVLIFSTAFIVWYVLSQKSIDSQKPAVADDATLCGQHSGSWNSDFKECTGIDQQTCESIGGTFNSCASPCRHEPNASNCILMCVEICEF